MPVAEEKKLTLKQKGFVDELVKTRNATESANRIYAVKNRNVANNIGAENLAKPSVRTEIEKRLAKSGLNFKLVTNIHKRNLAQDKELGVSQSAVRDYYKIAGFMKDESDKSPVNVAILVK